MIVDDIYSPLCGYHLLNGIDIYQTTFSSIAITRLTVMQIDQYAWKTVNEKKIVSSWVFSQYFFTEYRHVISLINSIAGWKFHKPTTENWSINWINLISRSKWDEIPIFIWISISFLSARYLLTTEKLKSLPYLLSIDFLEVWTSKWQIDLNKKCDLYLNFCVCK